MAVTSQTLDYPAALDLLYGRLDYERNATVPHRLQGLHLNRMRRLLSGLGNPHSQLRVIHLAGTKGKGSTAAMIASILSAAGYRTGLYTSPHLHHLEERMVVDGVRCSPTELVDLVDEARTVIDELDQEAESAPWNKGPTFFEITTALAWRHFVRKSVDFAVVEVGMGGRLDSTNVCHPLVSVITSISHDHNQQLGDTLTAIATEKAGIIKPGVPVVSGVTELEPAEVIRRAARQGGCPLVELGRDFWFCYRRPEADNRQATVDFLQQVAGDRCRWNDLRLRLLGQHQAANAAVALAVIGRLQAQGWPVAEPYLRQGLVNVDCPARVEVVGRHPTIIMDTAHNHASVTALLEVLDDLFHARRRVLIFAATSGKDIRRMLGQLLPRFDRVIVTQYLENPRSAPLPEVHSLAREVSAQLGLQHVEANAIVACETPREAWRFAQQIADPDDLVCVTGSFFLAAEMSPLVGGRVPDSPAGSVIGSSGGP